MGYDQVTLQILAYPSRHNSDQDITDDWLIEELQERIRLICMEHRYESLN